MKNKEIQKSIASANINFLIGAGLSAPFLTVLNEIEQKLNKATNEEEKITIRKEYFEKSMLGNLELLKKCCDECEVVFNNYKEFYKIINHIVLKRESSILSKQINIFTTNIDIFSEMALEITGIEFNDGFHGRFNPKYDVGNFKKSYYKTSLHYENTSEIPVFNILKLHGSVSWKAKTDNILLDKDLRLIKSIKTHLDKDQFNKKYDKLMIVNPEETKFKNTTLNQKYYDLLRMYANELEKENSVLFVMGFSFSDKHIMDLTLQVANSNPTLKIYIFSYEKKISSEYKELEQNSKNTNIEILLPEKNKEYNFEKINEIFESILKHDTSEVKNNE